MLRTHTCGELRIGDVKKQVTLAGWVEKIRSVGSKLTFVDLRDRYGKTQIVILGKPDLKLEYCVQVSGEVAERKDKNPDIATGEIEVFVGKLENIKFFNECPPLPFNLDDTNVDEDTRLKYRFLDLRRQDLQKNLILRHKIIKAIRDHLDKEGFVEIETPLLGASTPEGARDYLVPSRINPGKFYALPQSPQIYKQLLMVSGLDKYFQIARCLRDEDLRADRQPEFTQLDVEMTFVKEEDVFAVVEKTLAHAIKEVFGIHIKTPFQRLPYSEAMKKYNSDKPDLRKDKNDPKEFAFAWIVDFPMFEWSKDENRYVAAHHPFCMPSDVEKMESDPAAVKAHTYDLVLNGVELLSGSIRVHNPEIQRKIFKALGFSEKEAEEKFGFMLKALSYGAPPHGGFAIGLDRLIQILTEANSIREVIAFPKNKDARDLMMDAPSDVSERQLKEIHIKTDVKKK